MKKTILSLSCLFFLSCTSNIKKEYDYKTKLFTIEAGITNVYVIKGEKNILVDTGEHGTEEKIISSLKSFGMSPNDISLIVLTHAHGDHAGGVKYFKDKYNIPVLVGKNDDILAKNGKNDELKPTDLLAVVTKNFIKQEYPAFTPDIIIDKTFDLRNTYGINGKIIYTPSHTEGSLVILLDDDKALVGDLIRGGTIFKEIPTVHFFHNDIKKVNSTLKDLVNMDIKTFYTGHFGPLKGEDIKKVFFAKKKISKSKISE
ncbi:MAG: MBL fold metallo-hydrolase [Candidatus Sericytochromatia bacterium]